MHNTQKQLAQKDKKKEITVALIFSVSGGLAQSENKTTKSPLVLGPQFSF